MSPQKLGKPLGGRWTPPTPSRGACKPSPPNLCQAPPACTNPLATEILSYTLQYIDQVRLPPSSSLFSSLPSSHQMSLLFGALTPDIGPRQSFLNPPSSAKVSFVSLSFSVSQKINVFISVLTQYCWGWEPGFFLFRCKHLQNFAFYCFTFNESELVFFGQVSNLSGKRVPYFLILILFHNVKYKREKSNLKIGSKPTQNW